MSQANAVPLQDFVYNDFAYALKYSVGPDLAFGDSPLGNKKKGEEV
jgi:hypothetical protein